MPVALLNELVLMAVGLILGYKTGKKAEKLHAFMEENDIHSYKDALKLLKALYAKATVKETSC